MIRWLKIAIAASVSAFFVFYAIQNVINLGAAYWFVETMVGMQGHEAYPDSLVPAVRSAAVVWAMLWIIIVIEFAAGILAAKGAFDMFMARNGDAGAFNASKEKALAGTLLGVFLYFGIFSAIGGALFQMWQTELGHGAFADAGMFSIQLGVMWMILKRTD